jgi:cytochrome c oxidase subunit 4
MNKSIFSPITYVVVDAVLVVLTIFTVGLSFVEENGAMHVIGGLAVAVVKAALVVLFFMHVLRSRAQTRAVIVVTVFWLAIVLFVLTFSDYVSRGWVPNMPGH